MLPAGLLYPLFCPPHPALSPSVPLRGTGGEGNEFKCGAGARAGWFSDVQRGEGFDDAGGLDADLGDAGEEVEGVAGVVHGLKCPVVGVVDDGAGFVGFDGLAFHDPVKCGFAVDDVFPGFGRDAAYGDVGVVDDGGFVFFLAGAGVFHFFHAEGLFGRGGFRYFNLQGIGFAGFVVQVPAGEFAPGF